MFRSVLQSRHWPIPVQCSAIISVNLSSNILCFKTRIFREIVISYGPSRGMMYNGGLLLKFYAEIMFRN
jgi:hypothetical protein